MEFSLSRFHQNNSLTYDFANIYLYVIKSGLLKYSVTFSRFTSTDKIFFLTDILHDVVHVTAAAEAAMEEEQQKQREQRTPRSQQVRLWYIKSW